MYGKHTQINKLSRSSCCFPSFNSTPMDFSLCLQCCGLSSPLLFVPSTVKFSRSDKPHFNFPFSPLSLAKKYKSSTVSRPILISPITCATNGSNGFSRPTANSEVRDHTVRGSFGVSLATACVLAIIGCSHIMKQQAHALLPSGSARAAESITTKVIFSTLRLMCRSLHTSLLIHLCMSKNMMSRKLIFSISTSTFTMDSTTSLISSYQSNKLIRFVVGSTKYKIHYFHDKS